MPGLVGHVAAGDLDVAGERFGAALDRMRRHPGLSVQSTAGRVWRLANVSLATLRAAESGTPNETPQVIFHGVLHNEATLRSGLQHSQPIDSRNALLWHLYLQAGPGFVERLEGEFSLALFDDARRRLVLATDPIGSHPLYWRAGSDGFIFSSDLSALLRAAPDVTRLDLRAVADYLTVGAVLGDKTLAEGVHLVDPGTVLIYDLEERRTQLQPYVQLQTFFRQQWTNQAEYLEAVQAAFTRAVGRALNTTVPVGLSLSGGLDSRAILSAVNDRAPTIQTYTLGVEGCADQVIADQLSRIAGTRHRYFPLDGSYLDDFLANMAAMVSMTDGMYLSHGLTEMLAVRVLGETDIGVLIRGHGGELAKAHLAWPLHTDAHVYEVKTVDELIPYLASRDNLVSAKDHFPLAQLLRPEVRARAGTGGREAFAAAVAGTNLSPAECCSYLYLREFNRRFTIPSLELFRTRVQVRLPYLDVDFLKVLLAAPSSWRDSTRIHQALTARGCPRLLKVRNSNTGAPADAGPLLEFVLDKCNSALKRLNLRGYRHYHNFDGWMRKGLLDSVESELLTRGARVQSIVAKTTLQELVRQTRSGEADRSYLLQVLLILELWQRENHVEAAA